MLTFKRKFLDAIRSGQKTQTLRIWKSKRVQAGQITMIPAIGPAMIDSIQEVSFDDLTDADAILDGFPTLETLKEEIAAIYGDAPEGILYKVQFHLCDENAQSKPNTPPVSKSDVGKKENSGVRSAQKRTPQPESKSSVSSCVKSFIEELTQDFSKCLENYMEKNITISADMLIGNFSPGKIGILSLPEFSTSNTLTEEQVVEKIICKCKINRNVCDWNHEPGKSQDFFALFLQAPCNAQGIPTLDGYRLRSLVRDKVSDQEWEEISWIASEVCTAWTEWQYAIEHWKKRESKTN